MKFNSLFAIGLLTTILSFPIQSNAQCPPGNLVLASQADVNAFVSAYPNCTELPGDLKISSTVGSYIDDLSALNQITSVAGKLSLPSILNDLSFDGLENIQSVRSLIVGDAGISQSVFLWNTDLAAIGNISGHLDSLFLGNTAVENFGTTFPNVTSVGYLRIANNDALTAIPSFPGLTAVEDLTVSSCNSLVNLVLPANIQEIDLIPVNGEIITFNSGIFIQQNQLLESIACNSNFPSLRKLVINFNDGLESISGFPGLNTISQSLILSGKAPSMFNSLHLVSHVESASVTLEEIASPIIYPEMYIGLGQNASALTIGGGGITIAAPQVSQLIIAGPMEMSEGNIQLSGTFHTLTGLGSLQEIGGNFQFACPELTQLPNMPQLSIIGGDLLFLGNQLNSLTNFEGLGALTGIMGTFRFGPALTAGDYALESYDGLDMLTEVGGDLEIRNMASLTDIQALAQLTGIGGQLKFRNLPTLTEAGMAFPNLTGSGGLYIENTGITSIPDLPEYLHCNGGVEVKQNLALTNTNAFANLSSLNGILWITNNTALESILFSPDLNFSGEFRLFDNENLNTCNSATVCMLVDLSSAAFIDGNGTGCTTLEEVEAGCALSTSDAEMTGWTAYQSQTGELTIAAERPLGNTSVSLSDIQGRQQYTARVHVNSGSTTLTIPSLASGIYVIQLNTPDQMASLKIWLK